MSRRTTPSASSPRRCSVLAEKVEHMAHEPAAGSDALSDLEHRIGALVRRAGRTGAERRHGAAAAGSAGASRSPTRSSRSSIRAATSLAMGHLEDRIVSLVERLDASDTPARPSGGDRARARRPAGAYRGHARDQERRRLARRGRARGRYAQVRHRPHPGRAGSGERHARPCGRPPGHDREGHAHRRQAAAERGGACRSHARCREPRRARR